MNTRVTTGGRITIPSVLRKRLDIKTGTRIEFAIDEETQEIILTPITRQYVHTLRGKYKSRGLLKALMSDRTLGRG